MGRLVNTVTGALPVADLGKTLMREHFVFGYPGFQGDMSLGGNEREEMVQASLATADRVLSHGVRTVVDATANECGRNPDLLREVSERSGLNIICSTGYYYEGEGASAYFKFRSAFTSIEEEIYEMFMRELTIGIGRTGIKAGVIELASSKGVITFYEQNFFRAAARASKETGAPIITHTQAGTMGLEQAQLLIEAGANPQLIMIGHMDGNTDVSYHLSTLKLGVTVAFDRYGLQGLLGMPTDEVRNALVMGLVGLGYADQICLSHDTINYWLGRPLPKPKTVEDAMASWHIGHIFEAVLPLLQRGGVTDAQVETMLVRNPARLFAGE